MEAVSRTVTSLTLGFKASTDELGVTGRVCYDIICTNFKSVQNLYFTHTINEALHWILPGNWASAPVFKQVLFSDCCVAFEDIAAFMKRATVADELIFYRCTPTDPLEETAFCALKEGWQFQFLDVSPFDGPDLGSAVIQWGGQVN
jgi:hypothetical protein